MPRWLIELIGIGRIAGIDVERRFEMLVNDFGRKRKDSDETESREREHGTDRHNHDGPASWRHGLIILQVVGYPRVGDSNDGA